MTVVTLLGINELYCVGRMGRGKELAVYLTRQRATLIADSQIDRTNDKRGKGDTFVGSYLQDNSVKV